jgi:hypothetical protein
MGSPYFASTATHHLSPTSSKTDTRIYQDVGLPAYTRTTTAWRDYPPASPHRLPTTGSDPTLPQHTTPKGSSGFGWLASPASARTHRHEHGNINPLSIDYACRPRLRSRLTLGGQTWPRNPWSFGGRDSHSAFATHACILTPTPSTPGHPKASHDAGRSPTQPPQCHHHQRQCHHHQRQCHHHQRIATASAVRLSPATLSAQDHLTSELLRTL